MSEKKTLLFEIGVEELPTKAVKILASLLQENIATELSALQLNFEEMVEFASPRRLAVLIKGLQPRQEDYTIEKKGPAINHAYDSQGEPSKALLGFAKSNQASFEQLITKNINGNEFICYQQTVEGKVTRELIPDCLKAALKKLAIAKPMRWASFDYEFVRPVHWLVLLYGDEVIEMEMFGLKADRKTYGHRFHAPEAIELKHANNYEADLQKEGYVIASFKTRKQVIHDKVQNLAKSKDRIAVIDEKLLDEVAGLVEWPVPLLVDFDKNFLNLPEESLISAMQKHQKVFHLIDKQGNLQAQFITVANIESQDKNSVIAGNEKVMAARLADAAFFFETDCKIKLEDQLQKLQQIIFQKELGTLYERAQRLKQLAYTIAEHLNLDAEKAKRAAYLAKADLVSDMVEEFPELQGTMGYYYALQQGVDEEIAMGIRGQYLPRFSGDSLPMSQLGCVVSLADRFDKLVGLFGINRPPSGEKDPFALRRAAIGVLTIVIEKHFSLDIKKVLQTTVSLYTDKINNSNVVEDVYNFIMERLKHWYISRQYKVEWFNAVFAKSISELNDFAARILAVEKFTELPEAAALAAANKRVSNLLEKENYFENKPLLTETAFQESAEKNLHAKLIEKEKMLQPLLKEKNYKSILMSLAELQKPIDTFFDEVMVMVEDEKVKMNRLALLSKLRALFLTVADISKL